MGVIDFVAVCINHTRGDVFLTSHTDDDNVILYTN